MLGLQAKQVTVRTKARESLSGDSIPTPVPIDLIRNRGMSNRVSLLLFFILLLFLLFFLHECINVLY